MTSTTDAFQDFATALYGQPGVRDACLRLQDEHGLDVNLALFAIWFGCMGHELDHDTMRAAMALSAHWNKRLVHPLRTLRRDLKRDGVEDVEVVRRQIASAEIAAERLLESRLFQDIYLKPGLRPQPPSRALVVRNLSLYLEFARVDTKGAEINTSVLIDAAFTSAASQ